VRENVRESPAISRVITCKGIAARRTPTLVAAIDVEKRVAREPS